MDLQKDLGLEDKLSVSDAEEDNELKESDFNFDLSDDEGNPIGESEEEYGVDIKSKPETISSFEIEKDELEDKIFPEQDEETLREIADDIEKEIEIDEISDQKEAIASGTIIDEDIDTKGLIIGEAESEELDEAISFDQESDELPDIPSEDLDLDLAELSQEDEFVEEIEDIEDIKENQDMLTDDEMKIDTTDIDKIAEDLDEKNLSDEISDELPDITSEALDEEISSDIISDELPEIPTEDLDLDLAELSQEDEFIEEIEEIEDIEDIKEDQDMLSDDEIKIDTSEINDDLSDTVSDELPDISSEDLDIDLTELNEDFQEEKISNDQENTIPEDLEVDLSEDEIESISNNLSEIEEEIDLTEIDIPSKFDSKIIDDSSDTIISADDNTESINIDDNDLKNIEEDIIDDDILLTEIDDDLSDIESIEELQEDTGSLDKIDLDNIPEPTFFDEEAKEIDSISLSLDELDNVTADANEETKIDFDNTDELKNEIYDDLKTEMIEKNDVSDTQNISSLKQNVKDVLEYLDQLLDALPEEKIKEFAESKIFDKYKNLFEELKIKN